MFQLVDHLHGRRSGICNQLLLQKLDSIAQLIQDLEIVVDHGIEQDIGQVVRAQPSHAPLAVPDLLLYGVKEVYPLILKREHIVRPQDQTNLSILYGVTLFGVEECPEHNKEILPQIVRLGTLTRVQDVLDDERVEPEMMAQVFDGLSIVDPLHVDPGHARDQPGVRVLVGPLDFPFVETCLIVFEQLDSDRKGLPIGRASTWRGG